MIFPSTCPRDKDINIGELKILGVMAELCEKVWLVVKNNILKVPPPPTYYVKFLVPHFSPPNSVFDVYLE